MAITPGDLGSSPKPRGESKVNSVDRALVILEYLGNGKEIGVRELGQSIGLSKSSVHRILQTLRARDFVKWNPQNARYSLGVRAFEVGSGLLRSMTGSAAKLTIDQLISALGLPGEYPSQGSEAERVLPDGQETLGKHNGAPPNRSE
ncbi:MAG: helix-turn-helix domain-containing protein [Candidatus Eremiobacteraeota bacterium]|nr:helix-turn-helix domain-containing protein [Candidatus Eremiobacteraeota bacterium]